MLDIVTTALELAAVTLLVVAAGWVTWLAVAAPWNGPAAATAAGAAAWSASRALQWLDTRPSGRDR